MAQQAAKHQPATPLPECLAVLKTTPHGNGYKMRFVCACGDPRDPTHCPRTLALNAERDRRAKAYTKLVKALRDLAPLLDRVPVFQLDDGKSSVKAVRLAGKFTEATRNARALLREIGEEV